MISNDIEYVQYCEALTNKAEWIEDCLVDRTIEWTKIENVALLEALKVAATRRQVSESLVYSGLKNALSYLSI